MKKKYLAILLAAGMVLSMSGCKNGDDKEETKQTQENGSESNDDKNSDNEGGDEGEASDGQAVIQPAEPTVALDMLDELESYVKLGKYIGIQYGVYSTDVTEDEILDSIRTLCVQGEFLDKKDKKIEKDDVAYIIFTGKIDGKSDDNLSSGGQEIPLEIGSNSFIPGFEDGLIGHKEGDEVVLNLTFPSDYNNSEYANKKAEFTVNVKSVKVVPEFTDEYINKSFGKKAEDLGEDEDSTYAKGWTTLDAAKKEIEKQIKGTKESNAEGYKTQDIVSTLIYDAKFEELPKDYVQEYIDQSMKEYETYASNYSMELEDFIQGYFGTSLDKFKEQVEDYAKEYVKEDIAMWAVAEAANIELTDEEYEKRTDELFEGYKDSYGYKEKSEFVENNGGEETVRYRLRLIIAREWIIEHAKAGEKYTDRAEYYKTLPWYEKK